MAWLPRICRIFLHLVTRIIIYAKTITSPTSNRLSLEKRFLRWRQNMKFMNYQFMSDSVCHSLNLKGRQTSCSVNGFPPSIHVKQLGITFEHFLNSLILTILYTNLYCWFYHAEIKIMYVCMCNQFCFFTKAFTFFLNLHCKMDHFRIKLQFPRTRLHIKFSYIFCVF